MDYLINLDQEMIIWIHQNLHSDIGNVVIPFLRSKYFWIPLYIFIISFVLFNAGKAKWLILFCALLTVTISDSVNSKILKEHFKRERPCNTELSVKMDLLVGCGSGKSFPSSHAANHFALSTFLFVALGGLIGRWKWLLILWAFLVIFGQVYVGVHYVFDVLGGMVFGVIVGGTLSWILLLLKKRFIKE